MPWPVCDLQAFYQIAAMKPVNMRGCLIFLQTGRQQKAEDRL